MDRFSYHENPDMIQGKYIKDNLTGETYPFDENTIITILNNLDEEYLGYSKHDSERIKQLMKTIHEYSNALEEIKEVCKRV